jgi:3-deoxy-D-manno-octulosonic-acid transferase
VGRHDKFEHLVYQIKGYFKPVPVFVYTLLCYLLLPFGFIAHLVFVWRRAEFRPGFWQRYGLLTAVQTRPVLVHAASVGELNAIVPLIEQLVNELKYPVLVTTTSVTGQARCQQLFGHNQQVSHAFLPLDIGLANRMLLHRVNPRAVLLVETELWPNLIAQCCRRQVPTMLINGRLSARSARGYQRFKWLVGPMLRQLNQLLVQDQQTADRFVALGAKQDSVTVLGSLKYDLVLPPEADNNTDIERLLAAAPAGNLAADVAGGLRWVCGSTRSGEEPALLQAWARLPATISGTLVLVPRHPQRFEEVADLCQQSGLPWARQSQSQQLSDAYKAAQKDDQKRVLLVDSMGLLVDYYRRADLVFVGGSLAATGGHNPLEAAALGKPVLMGPNCFNFAQVCDQLEQVGGLKITCYKDLLEDITLLLTHAQLRQTMGAAGQALVQAKKGALERHIAVLTSCLLNA